MAAAGAQEGDVIRTSLRSLGWTFIAAATFAAMPAMAEDKRPNVVFILADNVGYGDLGPTAGASCAVHQLRPSTSSPARVCASLSIWWSPPAHHRGRRS